MYLVKGGFTGRFSSYRRRGRIQCRRRHVDVVVYFGVGLIVGNGFVVVVVVVQPIFPKS